MEKYGTATQATDDKIILSMRFACWISNDTNTHSEYIILIAFHVNNGHENVSQCGVIRTGWAKNHRTPTNTLP